MNQECSAIEAQRAFFMRKKEKMQKRRMAFLRRPTPPTLKSSVWESGLEGGIKSKLYRKKQISSFSHLHGFVISFRIFA